MNFKESLYSIAVRRDKLFIDSKQPGKSAADD